MVVDVEKVARYVELANFMLNEEALLVFDRVCEVLSFLRQVQQNELFSQLYIKGLEQFSDDAKLELSASFFSGCMLEHIRNGSIRSCFDSLFVYVECLKAALDVISSDEDLAYLNYEIGFEYYYLDANIYWGESYQYLSACLEGDNLSLLSSFQQAYLYYMVAISLSDKHGAYDCEESRDEAETRFMRLCEESEGFAEMPHDLQAQVYYNRAVDCALECDAQSLMYYEKCIQSNGFKEMSLREQASIYFEVAELYYGQAKEGGGDYMQQCLSAAYFSVRHEGFQELDKNTQACCHKFIASRHKDGIGNLSQQDTSNRILRHLLAAKKCMKLNTSSLQYCKILYALGVEYLEVHVRNHQKGQHLRQAIGLFRECRQSGLFSRMSQACCTHIHTTLEKYQSNVRQREETNSAEGFQDAKRRRCLT